MRVSQPRERTGAWSPLVYMEDVTKTFGKGESEARVLRGVDLEIHRGEWTSIVGPSGCGKSTLLAIMGLMDSPTSGVYTFDGQPAHNLSASARARIRAEEIGFVFQGFHLIGDLTVFENVEQPLSYQKMKSAERRRRVEEALERVGMAEQARRRPGQLSGGEQQRVAVARALAGRPRMLLADEPTGSLDSANGEAIMGLLRDVHESGTTICMVTHDPRFVHLAHRVLHMLDGKIVSGDAVKEFGF
jgi:putative ABC transport system ATP-binding protein